MKRLSPLHRGVLPALALALLAALPRPGAAITVTKALDEKKVDSKCTLREAVQVAFDLSKGSSPSFPECTVGNGAALVEFQPGLGTITLLPELGNIALNFPVTIQGKQTISGGGKTQIFTIGSDPTVKLVDLVLEKGFIDGGGAAILVNGGSATLEIEGSVFQDNIADFGGAIAFNGSTLKIKKNSKFLGNEATFGRGGAIWGGGYWEIQGVEFASNVAFQGGGALNCENGSFLIGDSAFFFNLAEAVENDPTCGEGGPVGCAEGGGAMMTGCLFTITRSLFDLNMVFGQVGGGGVLVTDGGEGLIDRSVFRWNNAGFGKPNSGSGGAVFVRGKVRILQSAIEQNWAKGGAGGGLFFENSDGKVANTVVRSNTAQLDEQQNPNGPPDQGAQGGGIAAVGDTKLQILNSSLVDNYGQSELFFFGNGEVNLYNTLIAATWADATCDGDLSFIKNGTDGSDGRNAQTPEVATCEKVPTELVSTVLAPGQFASPLLPAGYKLEFQYPIGKFLTPTSGKGDPPVCKLGPVWGIDILGNPRTETCTIGAYEGEAG
jgi:CSLREA domain-containing protein